MGLIRKLEPCDIFLAMLKIKTATKNRIKKYNSLSFGENFRFNSYGIIFQIGPHSKIITDCFILGHIFKINMKLLSVIFQVNH